MNSQALYFLLILLALSSCAKRQPFTYVNANDTLVVSQNPPTGTAGKRLLALGDSYTIGQGVVIEQSFPYQSMQALKIAGANMAATPQIIAQTGWTTQQLLNGIATASPPPIGTYDLVTLLIGVNNQYQQLDTAIYRLQFAACLTKAISLAGGKNENVFVLSIPNYGATPFGASNATQITTQINQHNAINKQVSLQMNTSYTDITPSTLLAATDPTLTASDSLHPSGILYAKWVALLLPKMLPRVL